MTPAQFQASVGCVSSKTTQHYAPAMAAMSMFSIASRTAKAAFLANMGHESLGLHYSQEIWGPTPAQRRYEPPSNLATKLGNNRVGDGKRYLGRGPTQLTGRTNYRRMTADLRKRLPGVVVPDFEAEPDKAAAPEWAWVIACQFFESRQCVKLADAGDFDGVCRAINGGDNGIDDRRVRYAKALKATA